MHMSHTPSNGQASCTHMPKGDVLDITAVNPASSQQFNPSTSNACLLFENIPYPRFISMTRTDQHALAIFSYLEIKCIANIPTTEPFFSLGLRNATCYGSVQSDILLLNGKLN